MNTHDLLVDFGKHRGERWTRIPVSYLRWLVNQNSTGISGSEQRKAIAIAELKRRGISAEDRFVEISGHAIDSASLRVRKLWHEDRSQDEGIHAWLCRVCAEALGLNEIDGEGRIHHKGMRLVFETGELYPILKTVMRAEQSTEDLIDKSPPWEA